MLLQSIDKVYLNSGNRDVISLVTKINCTILDVGCGGGVLAKILSAAGHCVDGLTISEEELEIAKPFVRHIYLHNLEQGLPADIKAAAYDYVICSHVLEHIVYPAHLLQDIRQSLKSDGTLVVALPNIMHYKSRLQLMAGKFEYTDAGIWDYTHVKWYTYASARRLLVDAGFTIEQATVTGDLPLNTLFSKILPIPLQRKLYAFLIGISKGLFGYQILLTANKRNLPNG